MKVYEINGKAARKTYKVLLSNQSIPCDVTIFDDKISHQMKISEEDVLKFTQQMELSSEAYTMMLFQILTGELKTSFIHISNDEVTLNKTKSIKFFSKQSQTANYAETMQIVTDHLYQQNYTQSEEIYKLKAQNDSLIGELQKLQEKVENIIDNANQHENKLYSCLIQVLNEKKKYIQLLKNHIDEKDIVALEKVKGNRKRAVISESDTEEYDTDEEQQKKYSMPGPSTRSTKSIISTTSRSAIDKAMDIDSNVFDSDADSNDNETFCTVLPPRSTQAVEVESSEDFPEKEQSPRNINEVLSQEFEVETFPEPKTPEAPAKEQLLKHETPVITYSTQDMLDDI